VSSPTTEQTDEREERILYIATGVALAAAGLAAGWASGSVRVGVLGAFLAGLGVSTSWLIRPWDPARRLAFGALIGFMSASLLHGLIQWEISVESGDLYQAIGDVGLTMALRMVLLLVFLSFLLLTREMLPFSLVPALSLFGLSGGHGIGSIAFACFLIFLPAALVALAQAMLLSGGPARRRRTEFSTSVRWRIRHWAVLGTLIAVIIVLGSLMYLPAYGYGTQYYWRMSMMGMRGGPSTRSIRNIRQTPSARSYSIGVGPVAPTERVVLSYQGDPAPFWRGEVYDIYSGSTWRSSESHSVPLRISNGAVSVHSLFPPVAKTRLATHVVQVEDDSPFVLYSPGQIQQVEFSPTIIQFAPFGIYVDKFGCITAPEGVLQAETLYEVVSDPLAYERYVHRQRAASPSEEVPQSYLRIPLSSRRVADLARRIVADATTEDEKLQALISYLQDQCAYSLNAPAVPRGKDAADYFLFESKQGYCDLFATALAVMGRSVGIPTRFVVGYAGGQYDPELGRYVLRESDAHAWVEAYQRTYGWVTVDPAPAGGPSPMSPIERAVLSAKAAIRNRPVSSAAGSILIALALLLVIVIAWRRVRARRFLAPDQNEPQAVVVRAYARLFRMLARHGQPRRPTQTPLEYLTLLEKRRTPDQTQLSAATSLISIRKLTQLFLIARYSRHQVTIETAVQAVEELEKAQRALRIESRLFRPGLGIYPPPMGGR